MTIENDATKIEYVRWHRWPCFACLQDTSRLWQLNGSGQSSFWNVLTHLQCSSSSLPSTAHHPPEFHRIANPQIATYRFTFCDRMRIPDTSAISHCPHAFRVRCAVEQNEDTVWAKKRECRKCRRRMRHCPCCEYTNVERVIVLFVRRQYNKGQKCTIRPFASLRPHCSRSLCTISRSFLFVISMPWRLCGAQYSVRERLPHVCANECVCV